MGKRYQVNPNDLLGQAEFYPPHIILPGTLEPKLDIAWGSFHQNFFSNIPVFFQRTRLTGGVPLVYVLRDCRVEHPAPRRAILLAALVQILLLLIPWPDLPVSAKRNPAFDNTQLTWSGPIDDLPLLNMPREKKATPRAKAPAEQPPAEGADAFHPRQRIFTDPSRPHASAADSGESCGTPGSAKDFAGHAQRGASGFGARSSAAAPGDQRADAEKASPKDEKDSCDDGCAFARFAEYGTAARGSQPDGPAERPRKTETRN